MSRHKERKMNRREVLVAGAMAGATALLDRGMWAMSPAKDAADPVAKTTHGPVRGYWSGSAPTPPGPSLSQIACFKGIPYGLDTKLTRFAAPKPPVPWKEE